MDLNRSDVYEFTEEDGNMEDKEDKMYQTIKQRMGLSHWAIQKQATGNLVLTINGEDCDQYLQNLNNSQRVQMYMARVSDGRLEEILKVASEKNADNMPGPTNFHLITKKHLETLGLMEAFDSDCNLSTNTLARLRARGLAPSETEFFKFIELILWEINGTDRSFKFGHITSATASGNFVEFTGNLSGDYKLTLPLYDVRWSEKFMCENFRKSVYGFCEDVAAMIEHQNKVKENKGNKGTEQEQSNSKQDERKEDVGNSKQKGAKKTGSNNEQDKEDGGKEDDSNSKKKEGKEDENIKQDEEDDGKEDENIEEDEGKEDENIEQDEEDEGKEDENIEQDEEDEGKEDENIEQDEEDEGKEDENIEQDEEAEGKEDKNIEQDEDSKNEILRSCAEKFKGTYKIPILNCRTSTKTNRIRPIDRQYVSQLKSSLKCAILHQHDVPLPPAVGVLDNMADLEKLVQGDADVELIGGNHTMTACKELAREDETMSVLKYRMVNVYHGLTADEVKTLALKANEDSSAAKPTSQLEKLKLLHQQLEESGGILDKGYINRMYMMFNCICPHDKKEETKKKRKITTLLRLASLKEDIWVLLMQVLDKHPSCGLHNFYHLINVSVSQARYILTQVLNGSIAQRKVAKEIASLPRGPHTEELAAQRLRAKKVSKKVPSENVPSTSASNKEDHVEQQRQMSVLIESNTNERNTHQTQQKEYETELKKKLDDSEDKVRMLERKLLMAEDNMQVQEEESTSLKKKVEDLDWKVQNLERKLSIAKETLLRKDKYKEELVSELNILKRKLSDTEINLLAREEELEGARKKQRISEETVSKALTEKIKSTAQLNVVQSSIQLAERSDELAIEDDFSTLPFSVGTHYVSKRKRKNSDSMSKSADVAEEEDIVNEIQAAVVEYNRGQIYLGQLQDNNSFNFCKTPMGKIEEGGFIIKTNKNNSCYKLSKTDIQTIDKDYIVFKFKAKIIGNQILKTCFEIKDIQERVKKYIEK